MRGGTTGLGIASLCLALIGPAPARAVMTFDDYSISPAYRACRGMGGFNTDSCVCIARGIYDTINRGDEQLVTILMQGFPLSTLRKMGPNKLNEALASKGIYTKGEVAMKASNVITGAVDYCAQTQEQGQPLRDLQKMQ